VRPDPEHYKTFLNMKSETIKIKGIGPVLFERSSRARHVNISVRPFVGVRVAVPFGVSFKEAENFAVSKKDWIKKHQAKIRQMEQDHRIIFDEFNNINRRDARKILVRRLAELAGKYGFKYNRIFIRNQKTRWGSCSAKNNISLNVKLVRLPEALRDYILIHELIHTRIKNHSRKFYAELYRIVGDWKLLDSRLKKYGPCLL